ncbi:hypothetical protein OIU85_003166 [Salix viminalis]|uniref:Uncharacterized protein n=1 Tax=Salix viminalis TaxID=40686 RepID=A0A9Q0PZ29_SALVM|nr:hypothetical protein OIU85_003166 [Salix viminalis]
MIKNMLPPLSFLLLASSLLPEAARASGNPVLDVNGFGLLPGVPYYMVSSQWPIGGGVVSLGGGDVNGSTCPLAVILLENFCVTGTPITFSIASGEGQLFILGSSVVSSYKLVSYKLSSYDLALTTSDVGAVFDYTTGIRYLALTEPPLIVGFQVAYDYDGLNSVV